LREVRLEEISSFSNKGGSVGEEGWASLKDSPERWRSELAKSKRSQGEPGAGSVQEPMESSAGLS